jgi:hypothetical protein
MAARTSFVDKEAGMGRTLPSATLVLSFAIVGLPGKGAAQHLLSPEAARELARALDVAGLESIAAADSAEPGAFVAALHIRGAQMLVVSARHPSVEGLTRRITGRQYRDVYLDLQGTPTTQGKFFVQDSGADGISNARPQSGGVDVLYEDGVRQTLFNGEPKAQKLSPAEYSARLAAADARYAHLLTLLTAAAREATASKGAHGQ